MHTEDEQAVKHCLHFAASRFVPNITKLTEETFDFGDLPPSYL